MLRMRKHHEMRLENDAQTAAEGATADADGLYHRPGWERFDQWVRGREAATSSESSSFLSARLGGGGRDAGTGARGLAREGKKLPIAVASHQPTR